MTPDDVPVLGPLIGAGADDRVFDALLLAGAPLVCLCAVVGRTTATTAIAAAYLAVFVGYTLYKAL
jgi:hypothetical protein